MGKLHAQLTIQRNERRRLQNINNIVNHSTWAVGVGVGNQPHPLCPYYLPFAVGLFDADRIYGGQFVTVLAKGLDPAIDIALRVPCQPCLVRNCTKKNTCVNNINFLANSYKLLNKRKIRKRIRILLLGAGHVVWPFEFIGVLLLWLICYVYISVLAPKST